MSLDSRLSSCVQGAQFAKTVALFPVSEFARFLFVFLSFFQFPPSLLKSVPQNGLRLKVYRGFFCD